MPFGAIKDLVSGSGRKAAETAKRGGKAAYRKAKEADQQMVESHGSDGGGSALEALTGGNGGDGGGRWENDPAQSFGRDMSDGERTVLGSSDFDNGDRTEVVGVPDDGGRSGPGVPDALGGGRGDGRPSVPDPLGGNDGDGRPRVPNAMQGDDRDTDDGWMF